MTVVIYLVFFKAMKSNNLITQLKNTIHYLPYKLVPLSIFLFNGRITDPSSEAKILKDFPDASLSFTSNYYPRAVNFISYK